MGKKSRSKKIREKWVKKIPDEVIQWGAIRIERYGRHVRFLNNSTPEKQAALLKQSEEINKKIIEDLENEVKILQNFIQKYNPLELMSRAAYVLLELFKEKHLESELNDEESYYLPSIEYIQYLIARTEINLNGGSPSEEEWEQILQQAVRVLRITQNYISTMKGTDSSEIDELRFILDSQRLFIRVHRYPFFLFDYLRTSLIPYERWIKQIYGIGVEEMIEELKNIAKYLQIDILNRGPDAMSAERILTNKLREKGFAVDPESSLGDIEKTRAAIFSEDFIDLYNEMQEKMRLAFTPAIFEITKLTSLPKSFLSALSIKPGESVLTTLTRLEDYEDLSPLSTSLLHYKPFLELDSKYYTFYHSGFEDRIPEIIEEDLFQKLPEQKSAMLKERSDRIESDSKELLTSIIKPDFEFRNIYYPNPDDPGNLTELDILLGIDDILFIVEVKAGAFSAGANRGAPKDLAKKLSELIIEGQRQSERAERYAKSSDEITFFDKTGKNEVYKIRHSNFRKIFRIVVTREQLGWAGARIATLSILDPNLSKSFPWHISIDDLRIVAELFKYQPINFVHYLEQRLQASSEIVMGQHDEIEHVGLYFKINQYHDLPVKGMDRISFSSDYMRDIDNYFTEKNTGNTPPIPSQVMPKKMGAFICTLNNSALPSRFEIGSIILSLGDEGRKKFEEGMGIIDQGISEKKLRTFRMPFTEVGISITYVDNNHWQKELKKSAVQMEQSSCKKWLVIQLEPESFYKISKIESIFPNTFSDEELTEYRLLHEKEVETRIKNLKPGRNDNCLCGSGKKFKKCHGSS